MTEQAKAEKRQEATTDKGIGYVSTPFTLSTVPTWGVPATSVKAEDFTKDAFEKVLDKTSRPTGRGKLAHLRPNSEDFARRKQEEIDFEERR